MFSLSARTTARRFLTPTSFGRPTSSLLLRSVHSDQPPQTPKDPWPLPASHPTPNESADAHTPFDIPPLDRSYEDIETTRKRLVYQTRKRGMLEGDLLLATFARERLGTMEEAQVREFDQLLDEPDWDIYYWCTYKKDPPAKWANSPLLEQLRQHTKNEGRVVRAMPDLDAQPTSPK